MTLKYGTKVKSKIPWREGEQPPNSIGTVVEPVGEAEQFGHSLMGGNIVELDGERGFLFDDETEVIDD